MIGIADQRALVADERPADAELLGDATRREEHPPGRDQAGDAGGLGGLDRRRPCAPTAGTSRRARCRRDPSRPRARRAHRGRAAAADVRRCREERSTCRRPTPRTRRRSRRPDRSAASAGIAPPPFSICFATVSSESGARLSRSGPTLPLVPASLREWQAPQVATNDVLPAATSAPASRRRSSSRPSPRSRRSSLALARRRPWSPRRSSSRPWSPVVVSVVVPPSLPGGHIHRLGGRTLPDGDLARDGRTGELRLEAAGRSDGDGGEDEEQREESTCAHAE